MAKQSSSFVTDWVKFLPLQIQETSILDQPNDAPVEKGEKVVLEECSDELKKLWSLFRTLKKEAAVAKIDGEFENDSNALQRFWDTDNMADVIKDLFWLGARHEAGLYKAGNAGLGIRKGWKVILLPKESILPPDLRRLLGGGGDD